MDDKNQQGEQPMTQAAGQLEPKRLKSFSELSIEEKLQRLQDQNENFIVGLRELKEVFEIHTHDRNGFAVVANPVSQVIYGMLCQRTKN